MHRASATLALSLALLPGCVLFPGFPPVDMGESTVVVENQSDRDLVVRFESPGFPLSFAVPAQTAGTAFLYGGPPSRVELLADDCSVRSEAGVKAEVTFVRIGADGRSISTPSDEPPDSARTLAEYFECDAFGAPPVIEEVDLTGLAGTMVVGGSDGSLWVVELPSGQVRELAADYLPEGQGAMSPDGSVVAVTRYDELSGEPSVWLHPIAGGESELVAENAANPVWSPAGGQLAVTDVDPFGGGLIIVSPATGRTRRIEGGGGPIGAAPAWSADGESLAYVETAFSVDPASAAEGAVMIASLDGQVRQLARPSASGPIAWSSDGARIAVETSDGTTLRVTVIDARSGETLYSLDAGMASAAAPSWSPDGTQLAYVRGTFLGGSQLMLVAADGSAQTEIGELVDAFVYQPPAWSRDGAHLLVATFGAMAGELWLFSRDGGEPVRLMSGVSTLMGWR